MTDYPSFGEWLEIHFPTIRKLMQRKEEVILESALLHEIVEPLVNESVKEYENYVRLLRENDKA